jgi:hypothetical protein
MSSNECKKMDCNKKCCKPYTLFIELAVKNKFWKIFESVCFIDVMQHLYSYGGWNQKWFVLENFNDKKYYFETSTFLENASMIEFSGVRIVNKLSGIFTHELFSETTYNNFMEQRRKEKEDKKESDDKKSNDKYKKK